MDTDELQRSDLIPYTALMPELDAIMISHLHFPRIDKGGLPASLSRNIIQRLLRDRLGFEQHLVLTDDLDMRAIQQGYGTPEAACLAIEAGADLVLLCHEFMNAQQVLASLQELPNLTLYDSDTRIATARSRLREPPEFSEKKLTAISEDLAKLRREVLGEESGPDTGEPPQSPVEDY